jgi:soluble lytic murein transglycosylase-like protein
MTIQAWVVKLPWDAITKTSNLKRVDPLLIGAIVSVESSGNAKAVRYESHYKWLVTPEAFASRNRITEKSERVLQMSSMGLMQIMGANARAYGHLGPLVDLYEPEIGLKYGIEHLTKLIDKYSSINDAISAYNQGSPRKNSKGQYTNQKYVDKIISRFQYLKDI